jgi:hypothetical protein
MDKFEWLCKRSGFDCEESIRWRVFVNFGSDGVRSLFKKYNNIIKKYFKSKVPSNELLQDIFNMTAFFDDSIISTSAMAYALTKESYKNPDIGEDLLNICEVIEKNELMRIKREGTRTSFDDESMSVQEQLMSVLANNLIHTRVLHMSVEEAEARVHNLNYISRQCELESKVVSKDDVENGTDYSQLRELLLAVTMLSYQIAHYVSENLTLKETLKEKKSSGNIMAKAVKDAKYKADILERAVSSLEKKNLILEEALKQKQKPDTPEIPNESEKNISEQKYLEALDEKDKIISSKNQEIENLTEQLSYYSEISDFIDMEYMEEEDYSEPYLSDEEIRERLSGYRVVIYGGHEDWRKNAKKFCDSLKINAAAELSFSARQRVNDIVIYNMCSMGHSQWKQYLTHQCGSPVKTYRDFIAGISKLRTVLTRIIFSFSKEAQA